MDAKQFVKESLEFYANKDLYYNANHLKDSTINEDEGDNARAALKEFAKLPEWTSPAHDTPNNGEIVIIDCIVEGGRIVQSAVYQRTPENVEAWHCGQPFMRLLHWLRLPPLVNVETTSLKGSVYNG